MQFHLIAQKDTAIAAIYKAIWYNDSTFDLVPKRCRIILKPFLSGCLKDFYQAHMLEEMPRFILNPAGNIFEVYGQSIKIFIE